MFIERHYNNEISSVRSDMRARVPLRPELNSDEQIQHYKQGAPTALIRPN